MRKSPERIMVQVLWALGLVLFLLSQIFLFFSAKIRIFVLQFYLKTLIKSWLFEGGEKSKLHDSVILCVSFTTEFLLDHQAHPCMF